MIGKVPDMIVIGLELGMVAEKNRRRWCFVDKITMAGEPRVDG